MTRFVPLPADAPAIAALHDLYGFPPDAFAGQRFWLREDSGAVWMTSEHVDPLPAGTPLEAVGLLVTRDIALPTRVSAAFVRRFGRLATRAVLTLSPAHTALYARGERVPWPDEVPPTPYAIIVGRLLGPDGVLREVALGRGRLHGSEVSSELPKANRFEPDGADQRAD